MSDMVRVVLATRYRLDPSRLEVKVEAIPSDDGDVHIRTGIRLDGREPSPEMAREFENCLRLAFQKALP